MKSRSSKSKSIREKLEERIKYFLDRNISKNTYDHLKNTNSNNKTNSPTLKDSLIHPGKDKPILEKRPYNNNLNPLHQNINISSFSTQIHATIENNINNSNNKKINQTIPIKKEMIKYVEPRFKLANFIKLDPKFNKSIELKTSGIISQEYSHEVTKSELEMMEIDEKLPIKKMEQMEAGRIRSLINENFPFHFLMEIEKCYQEISKDLKINKNKNLDYKIKIAATYLSILKNEENIIYNLFFYNKNMNQFLIRELCVFLAVLFLNDFDEIKNTDILDFLNCISYCHLNFIFLIKILVSKTNEDIFKNHKNNNENQNNENPSEEENNNSDFYYQQCKTLIELNSDKIDLINSEHNFHNNNKIIKNMFLNLITNLSYINDKVANNILEIFNLSKSSSNSKFRDILNNHIKSNELINEKINKIIRDSISQENKANITDDEDSENLPQPESPYFPPKDPSDNREYCLVLDLDETLVHFFEDENEAYVKVRLGTENFIRELSKYCEIAIFTASTKYYADKVIDGLDCKDLIDFRLYRQHTTVINGINVKDLSRLGRDLSKIIIIDNIEENYQFQKNNGLNICDFEGDENDNELNYLLEDLLKLVSQPGKNVCNELPAIRRNMQKRYTNIS